MKRLLVAVAFSLVATATLAHSPLKATSPADGAVLSTAPTELTFSFMRDVRMTRVTWTRADTDEGELDLDGQTAFVSQLALPFEGVGSGTYVIAWRGLSDDGHPQNGTFTFVVE